MTKESLVNEVFETRVTCAACYGIFRYKGLRTIEKCPSCGCVDGRVRFQIFNGDQKLNSFQVGEIEKGKFDEMMMMAK